MIAAACTSIALSAAETPNSDSPEAELASFKIAPGFEVNLFASEKDGVVKPIQSRFDARGRLYVVGSTVYPQLQPGQTPNDKVIVLEDTDGDGRADKSTLFADGLFIPTGVEIGDGGVYVGNSTELLHLRDTDGDGRADDRRVVLRGFGTGDNHQNINSFQWSPGGELMFCQGLHAFSRVETPWGLERLDHAGIWRFRPRRLQLDPFFGGEMAPHNPWGFVFDHWGQSLVLAGNGHGIYYPLPVMIRGHKFTNIDQVWQNSRGRKLCGGDYVGNAHLPDDWQGLMVAGGFMNNAVYAFKVTEDGSGFSVADVPPLITSTSTSFRPVDVKIGPDGAIYVTDWYNPIIGHYQTSFRHPDRDKVHGRIWRVTAKGRPVVKQPRLAGASVPELLDLLKATDRFTRHQAKRLLADADTAAVTNALAKWVAKLDPADAQGEHHLFEALGVYESHEVVEPALLTRLLSAREPRARAYAAGVVGRWQDRLPDPLTLLRPAIADPHPRVRLAASVSATYVRRSESLAVALTAAEHPLDKFIDYAMRQAVYVLKPQWLAPFTAGTLGIESNTKQLEFLLKADGTPDTTRVLRARLDKAGLDEATREVFLGLLAETGSADDLAYLLMQKTYTTGTSYNAGLHARLLPALATAERLRKVRPSGDITNTLKLILGTSYAIHAKQSESATSSLTTGSGMQLWLEAMKLAGAWKMPEFLPDLERVATGTHFAPQPARQVAIESLAVIGGSRALALLKELAAVPQPLRIQASAVAGLASLDPAVAAERAAALLSQDLDEPAIASILSAFLARKELGQSLVATLKSQPPRQDTARLALRWLHDNARYDEGLVAVLNSAAGLGGEPLRATPDFVRDLVTETRAQGDPQRGAAVFRRADLSCMTCHSVGGEGGNIGPDLNSIGSGQPLDFIIGAVLEPNREVKENYEAVEVTTKDGESYTGYRVRGEDNEVVLREAAQNQILRFRQDNVKSVTNRGSVMPPGLVNHLTRAELRDLFSYLSSLGKPVK